MKISALDKLVADYGHACEKYGFASAACLAPYPSKEALEDQRYWGARMSECISAIDKWQTDAVDQDLKAAKESASSLLQAVVAGAFAAPKASS